MRSGSGGGHDTEGSCHVGQHVQHDRLLDLDLPSKPFTSKSNPVDWRGVAASGQNHANTCGGRLSARFAWNGTTSYIGMASHSLLDIAPYPYVVREFLLSNPNFDTVWTIQITSRYSCSTDQFLVPFDLPGFDGCDVGT